MGGGGLRYFREPGVAVQNRPLCRQRERGFIQSFEQNAGGMVRPLQRVDLLPFFAGDDKGVDFPGPDGRQGLFGFVKQVPE